MLFVSLGSGLRAQSGRQFEGFLLVTVFLSGFFFRVPCRVPLRTALRAAVRVAMGFYQVLLGVYEFSVRVWGGAL